MYEDKVLDRQTRDEASGAKEPRDGVSGGPEGSPPDPAALAEERDRVLAEKAELLAKFQRAQAEFENFRKRLQKEKEEAHEYAAMSTIASLLPIVDDFERALQTPGLDEDFKKGLELIYQRVIDVFTRAGMKPVNESGKFDPHLHHAVDRAPAESDEHDQTILEVYQRGYHFKDRLLRPAMVKVAVKE
jgi:molecular chaperone GrpE